MFFKFQLSLLLNEDDHTNYNFLGEDLKRVIVTIFKSVIETLTACVQSLSHT